MPNPLPSDLHVSAPLGDVSVAYFQDQTRYIARQVFPNIPVQKQYDKYFKYNKGDWFRTDVAKRAPGTESNGIGWNVTTDGYAADVWAAHVDIDDQTRANADNVFNLDRDATNLLTNQANLRQDKEWLARYFTSGVWDTDLTGVAAGPVGGQILQWDQAGSTPIEDIYGQKVNMMEKTGFMPNTLVIGARVWQQLQNHAEIIDRVKFTQAGFVTEDLVARALGVDRLLIAWATENTANEAQTAAFSYLAGKNAFLCYSAPTPGQLQPSAGYTFSWNGYMGASGFGSRIKQFRIEERAADRIEIEMAFALKTVSTDLGAFVSGVVS